LAILNLLPIPVLDGGVIARVLLESIFRKKFSMQILAIVQFSFMFIFLGFLIYISCFDISRILGERRQEQKTLKRQHLILDEQLLWNGLSACPN
jgi:Zn-dependent protease